MRLTFITIVFISFLSDINSQQSQNTRLSLSKAIEDGLAANYNIQIADTEVERARYNRQHGSPDRFPVIQFKINQTNRRSQDNSPTSYTNGTYSKNEITGSVNTDWLLFGGHRVKIENERLRQIEKQMSGQSKTIVENTIKQIIIAYANAQIEKEKLKLLGENRNLSQDKFTKATMDFGVDRISRFDLNNFQNVLLTDSINYNEQKSKYNQSIIKLKTLCAYTDDKNLILVDALDVEFKKYEYKDLEEEMLSNNSELQNALMNVDLINYLYKYQQALRKPVLKLYNSISNDLNTSKFSDEDRENGGIFEVYAGLSLSYNIIDGGQHKRKLQEHKMDQIVGLKRAEDFKLNARQLLQIGLEKYNGQVEILKLKKNLVKSLSENLTIAENRLENGFSIFLEYRDAKLELSKAQLEVLESIHQMKLAEVEIIKLIGGLIK